MMCRACCVTSERQPHEQEDTRLTKYIERRVLWHACHCERAGWLLVKGNHQGDFAK